MKGFASLRLRLIILPTLVVVFGLLILAVLQIGTARDRVRVETRASMEVGRTLIENALGRRRTYRQETALIGLKDELPNVRHVRFAVGQVGVPAPDIADNDDVPDWFESIISPRPVIERFRVVAAGFKTAGEVVMVANPDDELKEIWGDWRDLAVVLVVVSIGVALVVAVVVSEGLKPLKLLAEGLERLGEGEFDVALTPVADVELARVGNRFNRLAESLTRVTEDNRLLIGRLMSLQEAERKEIAHELHDEFFPAHWDPKLRIPRGQVVAAASIVSPKY